jgi:hypothetical protein
VDAQLSEELGESARGSARGFGNGTVYSRDTLGDLGTVEQLLDDDSAVQDSSDRQKDARTLDELRFIPGDYLCVAVMLPKNLQADFSTDPLALKSRVFPGLPVTNSHIRSATLTFMLAFYMGWRATLRLCYTEISDSAWLRRDPSRRRLDMHSAGLNFFDVRFPCRHVCPTADTHTI